MYIYFTTISIGLLPWLYGQSLYIINYMKKKLSVWLVVVVHSIDFLAETFKFYLKTELQVLL